MKCISIAILLLIINIGYGQGVNPFDIPRDRITISDAIPEDSFVHSDVESDTIKTTKKPFINHLKDIQNPVSHNNPFEIPSGLRQPPVEKSDPISDSSQLTYSDGLSQMNLIVLIYVLVMMVIITLAISINKKRFYSTLKACYNTSHLKTLHRDKSSWSHPQFIILYLFFVLNTAYTSWLLSLKASVQIHLFVFIGAIFLCYLIRHLVMWMIYTTYPVGNEVSLYNYSIAIHNCMLGIFMLPVILIIQFIPGISLYTLGFLTIAIVVVMYLLRQVKGLLLCLSMRDFSPIYFFVYLCAVEIAPILVACKVIEGALQLG